MMFMYFWLNYSDRNNHMKRVPIAVENIGQLVVKYLNPMSYMRFYSTWSDASALLETLDTAAK